MSIKKIIFRSAWAPAFTALMAAATLHADAAVADPVPQAPPAASVAPNRIVAVPVGSDVVRDWDGDKRVKFQFNDDGDRLGAIYTNQIQGQDSPMDSVVFRFPSLKVDRQTKSILLGGQVVGHYGSRVALPGYRLKYDIRVDAMDDGMNRSKVSHVEVYLEAKPAANK